ncbi:uncharacterized protein LOC108916414, partial [Anoplophora glabripennis]|uniref:uncharacterized protein LOC108916414 n=1 Tax=Anoplophora glabripennis TaxID=217634 RepID=UPI000C77B37E
MKLSIFFFSMLFSFGYQDSIPDTINEYIENLRNNISEPITIETLNPDLSDNDYVSGYLNISNVNMQGLKNFDLNITYAANIIPTQFVLTINDFKLDLDYVTDVILLNVSLLHIYGNGKISVELTNLTIGGDLTISLVPVNVTITGMQMHLDDAKFRVEGMLNDDTWSNRFSELLCKNVANIFNVQEHGLSILVEDALNKVIADIISSNTTLSGPDGDSE